MKNILTAMTIAAFVATSSYAETVVQPEPPTVTPEPDDDDGSDRSNIVALVLLLAFGAMIASQRSSSDLSEPRPVARPDPCFDKLDAQVACD